MRTYLTLLLAILSLHAIGQNCHISGTVRDEKKEPLMSAVVFVNGTGYLTDADGKYSVTMTKGIYNIACAYVAYQKKEFKNVKCQTDSLVINFDLTPKVMEFNEVVTVSGYSKPLLEKTEITTITANDIKDKSSLSVDDIAAKSVGVTQSDVAGAISIKGGRTDEVEYIVSGHKVEGKGSTYYESKPSAAFSEFIGKRKKESAPDYSKPAAAPVSPPAPKAGMLTSGEINDFSKWKMWNDLSKGEFEEHSAEWGFYPRHRYMTEVTSEAGFPICGAVATLIDSKGTAVWKARTDNTGKAELWAGMFDGNVSHSKGTYSIKVSYADQEKTIQKASEFSNGSNRVVIKADCGTSNDVDIVFTVDATGSMGDEINYLKTELLDVIRKAQSNNQHLTINLGAVFYRDHGDEYLTRYTPLDPDINKTYDFIKAQRADGGGDFPEAVDEALNTTLNDIKWHENARAKIVFLILDAPPHEDSLTKKKLEAQIKQAAEKGIRIVPLACSGVDKSTEYILRSFAMATNGTYTFLTDHSGVGDTHLKPSTDKYKVEYMNALILRLILQYSYYPDCADYVTDPKKDKKDLLDKTDKDFTFVDSTQEVNPDVLNDPLGEDEFAKNVKIYPNPTTGPATLEVKGGVTELFLTDISGKVLERYQGSKGEKIHIDLRENAAGLYFVRYMKDNRWKAGKIVLVKT